MVQVESAKRISLHHASGRNLHTYLDRRRPRNLSSRRLAHSILCQFRPGECWDWQQARGV